MNDTERSILKTVAYYDALGQYPLTAPEIFRHLQTEGQSPPTLREILALLKTSPDLLSRLENANGFYYLKGSTGLYQQRNNRQKSAIGKWKRLKKLLPLLVMTPFLRGLAVSGSLAIGNTKPESDIDLLVFTAPKKIWTCRTALSFILQMVGQRRHDRVIENKICLNHYLAQDGLTVFLQNLSNAQLYARLVPLTGQETFSEFQEQNQWINNFIFFWPQGKNNHLRWAQKRFLAFKIGEGAGRLAEIVLSGKLGDFIEKRLALWQTRRIGKKTKFRQLGENELCLSEKALLFHYPICKNKEAMEIYEQKLKFLNLV